MFNYFKKNLEEINNHEVEELTEKSTTKIGYFLLLIMGIVIFSFGQWVIFDIKDFIKKPISPTNCLNLYSKNTIYSYGYDDYYYRYNNNQTNTNTIDKKYGLDKICEEFTNLNTEKQGLDQQLNGINSQINSLNSQIKNNQTNYDLSLQERQANYNQNYNSDNIIQNINLLNQQIASLNTERSSIESKLLIKNDEIEEFKNKNADVYESAKKEYEKKFRWYVIFVFLARLAFILPVFIISLNLYTKLKKKNSANTIIIGAVLVPITILLLQITIGWVWYMFPKSWIEALLELFAQLAIFRYVIYYGAIILAILVLGGIVYLIQKRIFSPEKIALRRLKENKCPNCEFPINDHDFCGKCGNKLKETCPSCGQKRLRHMKYCSNCGKNETIKTEIK